mmetsp:Transcript_9122/g.14445  ORF Transcript_9122/g.14445 Transcript_9122/m.14445 type:complete len:112 (-) Transcript_9122:879-1214(-)
MHDFNFYKIAKPKNEKKHNATKAPLLLHGPNQILLDALEGGPTPTLPSFPPPPASAPAVHLLKSDVPSLHNVFTFVLGSNVQTIGERAKPYVRYQMHVSKSSSENPSVFPT